MKEHPMHHNHHHMEDHTLAGLLGRCCHIFLHRFGGKKRGQEGILSVISQHSGITQKELAEILEIQPASVSELLMKLEHKGLVLREKDEQDRRSIRVRLTQNGNQALQQPQDTPADPFQALSAEEQEQLRSLLQKLLADWQQQYPAEQHRHVYKHHKFNHQ